MELESIFSQGRVKTIGKTDITFKSIELGNLPRAIDIADKLFETFKEKKGSQDLEIMIHVAKNNITVVQELILMSTDINKDSVSKLNLTATVEILGEIIKENSDFLLSTLLPMIGQIMSGLKEKNNDLAGQIKSNS